MILISFFDKDFDFDDDLRVEFAIIFLYEIKNIIYLSQTQHPFLFFSIYFDKIDDNNDYILIL